jgi:hypothetical protein
MTPDQVELVAQAFFAAEYSDDWDDAPAIVQQQFRDLARTAITLLHQQISHCRSSLVLAKVSGAAHGEDAVQVLS